jgi:hypothetical protein
MIRDDHSWIKNGVYESATSEPNVAREPPAEKTKADLAIEDATPSVKQLGGSKASDHPTLATEATQPGQSTQLTLPTRADEDREVRVDREQQAAPLPQQPSPQAAMRLAPSQSMLPKMNVFKFDLPDSKTKR